MLALNLDPFDTERFQNKGSTGPLASRLFHRFLFIECLGSVGLLLLSLVNHTSPITASYKPISDLQYLFYCLQRPSIDAGVVWNRPLS
jgi:hypothetical protein